MFIKFKFNNTSRKIKKDISSFEELKQEATKIFGEKIIYCDFLYEDEDCEMVSIVDDNDLENCLSEAKDNGQKGVKIFLEVSSPKTKRARSISQKKAVVINENQNKVKEFAKCGSISDDSDFEILNSDDSVDSKMEKKYKKLEMKIKRKMEKLRKKKIEKLNKAERKASKSRSQSKKAKKNQGEKKHGRCHHHNRGHPWRKIQQVLNQVKMEVKVLKGNPELIEKFVQKCGTALVDTVKTTLESVKAENPEIVAKYEEQRKAGIARREERQKKKQEMMEKRKEKMAEKAKKQAEKQAKRQAKMAEIEAKKAEKQAEKEAKKAEKLAEKEAKKEAKKAEKKEERKASRSRSKSVGKKVDKKVEKTNPKKERNQEIRRRVQILVPIFKDTPRPELRKRVVADLDTGKSIQNTIQGLFA
jgi:hypothetical protein